MEQTAPVDWLFANGGPILRYRTALELMDRPNDIDLGHLFTAALQTTEVQHWLNNLGSGPVHHSMDQAAENTLAKLLDYGLRKGYPALDEKISALLEQFPLSYHPYILTPFLIRAGYGNHPLVAEWWQHRLETLYNSAKNTDYNFYMDEAEKAALPSPWREKPLYKMDRTFEGNLALPTCYDFYSMAYFQPADPKTQEMIETIVGFLSHPLFQSTVGGYGWDPKKRYAYAAGRVYLACANPERLVLFLEWGARFASARQSAWFQEGMQRLETYSTPQGTYRFPKDLVAERPNSYALYAGAHMGLGENRREPLALTLESTFRMLKIKKLIGEELCKHHPNHSW